MKVIISVLNGEAYPIMNDTDEPMMKQFKDLDEVCHWCNNNTLGQASENYVIDLESGEMELY